jgi:hypothetical protein
MKHSFYKWTILILVVLVCSRIAAQSPAPKKKAPFSISGAMGFGYEYYGLNISPAGSGIYNQRRPWNQLRFNFSPTFKFGSNFFLPVNFNFAAIPTNFAGPYSGMVSGGKQTVLQWITNPANNFSLNPTYKWAELQLGTQYLKYSDLTTGDVGLFGAGFSLKPKTWRFKFFTGTSQYGVDYAAIPLPGVTGAYKRNHWMFQVGKEEEGKYSIALNFSKGKDKINSVTSPPLTVMPQEGVAASLVTDLFFKRGWYVKTEIAESFFTRDLLQPLSPGFNNSFKPFISGRTSTGKDWAGNASIGKKSKDFDIAYATKYIGAGFQTTGYPYLQPDRWDNTINTRINTWKNKMNIVASIGMRLNNLSNTSLTAKQFIGSLNWFTQYNDRFSTNLSYSNFGFTTPSGLNPYGIKNVSNDLGLTTTYSWSNTKRMNMVTFSYNLSKYDERDVNLGTTTSNNTHTVMLSYLPTYFNSPIAPDFSVLYFINTMPTVKNMLVTFSSSVVMPAFKDKMQLRAQLQYTIGKLNSYSSNKNLVASINMDHKVTKKLTWNVFINSNYFKYGNELVLPSLDGANYFESVARTGLQYKF